MLKRIGTKMAGACARLECEYQDKNSISIPPCEVNLNVVTYDFLTRPCAMFLETVGKSLR